MDGINWTDAVGVLFLKLFYDSGKENKQIKSNLSSATYTLHLWNISLTMARLVFEAVNFESFSVSVLLFDDITVVGIVNIDDNKIILVIIPPLITHSSFVRSDSPFIHVTQKMVKGTWLQIDVVCILVADIIFCYTHGHNVILHQGFLY